MVTYQRVCTTCIDAAHPFGEFEESTAKAGVAGDAFCWSCRMIRPIGDLHWLRESDAARVKLWHVLMVKPARDDLMEFVDLRTVSMKWLYEESARIHFGDRDYYYRMGMMP
jgi:hypothetical protein